MVLRMGCWFCLVTQQAIPPYNLADGVLEPWGRESEQKGIQELSMCSWVNHIESAARWWVQWYLHLPLRTYTSKEDINLLLQGGPDVPCNTLFLSSPYLNLSYDTPRPAYLGSTFNARLRENLMRPSFRRAYSLTLESNYHLMLLGHGQGSCFFREEGSDCSTFCRDWVAVMRVWSKGGMISGWHWGPKTWLWGRFWKHVMSHMDLGLPSATVTHVCDLGYIA